MSHIRLVTPPDNTGLYIEKLKDEETMATEELKKEIKQRRGDFIHGVNWALKYMREDGWYDKSDEPEQGEKEDAARERFPFDTYRSKEFVWGTAVATDSGVGVTLKRNGTKRTHSHMVLKALNALLQGGVENLKATIDGVVVHLAKPYYGTPGVDVWIGEWKYSRADFLTLVDLAENPKDKA